MVSNFQSYVYSPGGVRSGYQKTNLQGGAVVSTDSASDLAITGRGFFPVAETATSTKLLYTAQAHLIKMPMATLSIPAVIS